MQISLFALLPFLCFCAFIHVHRKRGVSATITLHNYNRIGIRKKQDIHPAIRILLNTPELESGGENAGPTLYIIIKERGRLFPNEIRDGDVREKMDVEEFRSRGKEMVDYICDYLENIGSKRVTPNVEPGYLRELLPKEAPQEPEEWDEIMKDVDSKIMPGVTHWQHPRFHAYFPSGNSFPSILGDMLSDAIGCIGFSWVSYRDHKLVLDEKLARAGKFAELRNDTHARVPIRM